ncbi:transcriptional regulator [Rhizobium sp. Leaf384]|uniref:helix-turn-helix transcriptional regulator n=1 Tax=unclassified Rhizobium TaxID=2613769 RepID=UPI000713A541|nr:MULTISPECIES: AlpA family phage regulatory protein [unclassified Rhizobium]KQS74181.1 transcriptional regulator [Rhizobium sp. Leaf383]KQS80376.1 transcriptional regulator [Rhizobium sp. Leaf384]
MFNKHDNDIAVLVSLNQAAAMTSMSRGMLNRYRATGRFPAAVDLGDRRVAFVKSEVLDWIEKKIEARITAQVRKDR